MINNRSLVKLSNVSKSYDNGLIQAVSHVSLEIEKGKIYALMGPSGCGKSTLLNMIGTIDTPSEGTILYEGKPLEAVAPLSNFRQYFIGFVFQFHHLIPVLTLRENIEMAMLQNFKISAQERKRRADYLLKMMDIEKKGDAYANRISGGERQRGAIARALSNDPRLILADEPTGSVDSKTSLAILDKLKKYSKESNTSIVIATHDSRVSAFADEVIKMKDGRVVSVENTSR